MFHVLLGLQLPGLPSSRQARKFRTNENERRGRARGLLTAVPAASAIGGSSLARVMWRRDWRIGEFRSELYAGPGGGLCRFGDKKQSGWSRQDRGSSGRQAKIGEEHAARCSQNAFVDYRVLTELLGNAFEIG